MPLTGFFYEAPCFRDDFLFLRTSRDQIDHFSSPIFTRLTLETPIEASPLAHERVVVVCTTVDGAHPAGAGQGLSPIPAFVGAFLGDCSIIRGIFDPTSLPAQPRDS